MAEVLEQLVSKENATDTAAQEDAEWWAEAVGGGSGVNPWQGGFVPPPPRPLFLEDAATPDGLTTCDLCSWAWQARTSPMDAAREAPGELGWVLTLIIVSIISAAIGAVIMITALHCRSRMKNGVTSEPQPSTEQTRRSIRPPISTPSENKDANSENYNSRDSNSGVWSWLTSRRTAGPAQLTPPTLPAENHYTHMDETYSAVGEALYAELDRDSNSPAYQNSAYTDPDAPASSAPSSAYYSDLSVTTMPDRAYEIVGLNTTPCWDGAGGDIAMRRQPPQRLAAISETITMPSDYV